MTEEQRDDAAHPAGGALPHWLGPDVALQDNRMQMEADRHLAAESQVAAERLLAKPLAAPTSRRAPKSGRSSVPKPEATSRRVKS